MAVTYDREQFRKYLKDSGVVEALSKVLMKLYDLKDNRPNAPVSFIREQLADVLPSFADFENLKQESNALRTVLEGLKTSGQLTPAQLAEVENILAQKGGSSSLISARESEIAVGNSRKTSMINQSQIIKLKAMKSNPADYSTAIKKAIESLKQNQKCQSLLQKHISIELYSKLENVTTTYGSSLGDCISSGLEIVESTVGVYAADEDAYDKFAEFFNLIIKDYHEFESPSKHPALSWGDPTTFTNIDPNSEYITSTRIRCIRSVQGFPLIPRMSQQNFSDLYVKIKDAFDTLSGDAQGTWYELEGMDSQVKRDMINNRYILEYGDRFLESAGATEFWPVGRAVFLNDEKTFFVWVNEEDHLRFISMGTGSDFCKIYKRLISAVDQCSQKLPYAIHDDLGFLALCPSNLGNTIRASVMIKVPKLAKQQQQLEQLVKQHKLEIRGHTETFEISNKQKLGLTEYQSIKQLHDGILKIIEAERSL